MGIPHPRNSQNQNIIAVVLATKEDIETTHSLSVTRLKPTKWLSLRLRTKLLWCTAGYLKSPQHKTTVNTGVFCTVFSRIRTEYGFRLFLYIFWIIFPCSLYKDSVNTGKYCGKNSRIHGAFVQCTLQSLKLQTWCLFWARSPWNSGN